MSTTFPIHKMGAQSFTHTIPANQAIGCTNTLPEGKTKEHLLWLLLNFLNPEHLPLSDYSLFLHINPCNQDIFSNSDLPPIKSFVLFVVREATQEVCKADFLLSDVPPINRPAGIITTNCHPVDIDTASRNQTINGNDLYNPVVLKLFLEAIKEKLSI